MPALLFDFHLVTGIDSSAIHSFTRIKEVVDNAARGWCWSPFAGLDEGIPRHAILSGNIVVVPTSTTHWSPARTPSSPRIASDGAEKRSLRDWLAEELEARNSPTSSSQQCRRVEFGPHEVIARQGEPTEAMHFILEGRVGVIVDLEGGRTIRVRSLGQHTPSARWA